MGRSPDTVPVEVEGRRLALSNLGKVLYPATGFTKAAVMDYYRRVAPAILPHLEGRPLTLKRYPEGVDGGHFFEKSCPSHRPAWVRTVEVPSTRSEDRAVRYCVAGDLPTLMWLANLAALELHPLLARGDDVDCPTVVVFDLDPGPPAGLVECAQVAAWIREALAEAGLEAYPKTSGSKGVQLYVPLNTPHTYDQTKSFARQVASSLTRSHPEAVVDRQDKRLRAGKVLVDWGQNDRNKTTVAPYSLRAVPEPAASTPITWEELGQPLTTGRDDMLRFSPGEVVSRVERMGDLFRPVLEARQRLPGC
jgi:bifunctional non-homologous end joining protein LigD